VLLVDDHRSCGNYPPTNINSKVSGHVQQDPGFTLIRDEAESAPQASEMERNSIPPMA